MKNIRKTNLISNLLSTKNLDEKLLLISVNQNGNHWILLVIYLNDNILFYFDLLFNDEDLNIVKTAAMFIKNWTKF